MKEIQNLNSMIKTIHKEDPSSAWLLKIMVYWDILRDKNSTIQAFEEGIKLSQNNIYIYIEYWKFMKYLKKTDKMLEISEQLMKVVDNSCIPTDQWIEAHDLRFKTLLMKGSTKELIEEAINTLKKIWYILPPLPVDGLWYIKDAQEEAELKKEAADEKAQPFVKEEFRHLFFSPPDQSSSPSHRKTQSSTKIPSVTAGCYLSLKDGKSHLPQSKEAIINNIRKHLRENSKDQSSGPREDVLKAAKWLKPVNKSEKDQWSSDSSNSPSCEDFLRVTFKSDFLYQIGKVAAKSGFMLEKALKFLNDFLLVINYFKQDMRSGSYQQLRVNAIYYIGIAYFQLGDKETSERWLREIQSEMIDLYGKDHKKVVKIDSILTTYFTERFSLEQCITNYF